MLRTPRPFGTSFSQADKVSDARFHLPELKNPLIQATVESGWTFAPVVTFFRPLGG